MSNDNQDEQFLAEAQADVNRIADKISETLSRVNIRHTDFITLMECCSNDAVYRILKERYAKLLNFENEP